MHGMKATRFGVAAGGVLLLSGWFCLDRAQAAETREALPAFMDAPLAIEDLRRTRGAADHGGSPTAERRMRLGVVLFDELESPPPRPPGGTGSRIAPGTGSFRSSMSAGR